MKREDYERDFTVKANKIRRHCNVVMSDELGVSLVSEEGPADRIALSLGLPEVNAEVLTEIKTKERADSLISSLIHMRNVLWA